MEEKTFIKQLSSIKTVNSTFMVKYIAKMEGKDGRSYLNVILSDSSGEVEARKWKGAEEAIERIAKGSYVNVDAKVNLYQGRYQLIINTINSVDESNINLEDYIQKADTEPQKMLDELSQIIDTLDDVYIKDLLSLIVNDVEISRRLKLWSAAKTIHHAYQGGLLEHLLSCVKLGDTLSQLYKVNRNYVIAGSMLHDICKIYELTDGAMVDYTEEGKLVGHLVGAIELLERHTSKMKFFPNDTKMHLKHILISHHGEYEYGSPKLPQTSEAQLVHYIDLIDSKMASFEQVKKSDKQIGHWSQFVKHLDRIVYKKDLPSYTSYVDLDKNSKKENNPKKSKEGGELKQNLGSLLKDFKVE